LRSGVLFTVVSQPGIGRTTLALFMAYMAARSRATALFAAVGLDETEAVARLAARALNREHPELVAPYGAIWSGQALALAEVRAPLLSAVDTVVKKVGSHLHFHRAGSLEATGALAECAAELWQRHDRVVVVVDDLEGFFASSDGSATKQTAINASVGGRVMQVAFDLKSIAEQGCAVVATALSSHSDLVAPASTVVAELRAQATPEGETAGREVQALELVVLKNRLGPTGVVPLRMIPAAGVIEEFR
jgi:hypothetical protein